MEKETWAVLTGFALLSAAVLLLVSLSIGETMHRHPVKLMTLSLIWLGTAAATVSEGKQVVASGKTAVYTREDGFDFLGVLLGGTITFFLQSFFGLNAVLASSAVGLAGEVFFKRQSTAVYCGSFVGMASPALFIHVPSVALASFFASITFVLTKGLFQGAGGKLGTIAFIGSLFSVGVFRYTPYSDAVPPWNAGGMVVLFAVCGAYITYVLNHRFKLGPVAASALVGLAAGSVLPFIYSQETGLMYALMVFCATFAGMVSKGRIPKAAGMIPAGIVCAVLFSYSAPFLGGTGGKLGTIAFASILTQNGWSILWKRAFK